jgi:aminopeptidase N
MPSLSKLISLALFSSSLISLLIAVPLVRAADPALPYEQNQMEVPKITISDIRTDNRHGRTVLSLSISQEAQAQKTLQVPILIRTGMADIRFFRTISAPKTTMTFSLPDPPLQVIIDPDQELIREPAPAEVPPLWSRFLEAKEKTVVLASAESRKIFSPLLEYLQEMPVKIAIAEEIKNADLGKTAILFLGADNAAAHTLFARPTNPSDGFTLDVRNNPLDQHHVAVLVSSSSAEETKAAVQQMSQYQDASFLHFKKGKVMKKRKREGIPGQKYTLEQLPDGFPVSAVRDFAGIVDKLAASRIIYVGETHTSAADHLLQFRIIQALYKKDTRLAIGMEMFPSTAQQALDAYIMGDTGMDETDFLKKSQYFQTWGYDWRLFRDIFNFARMNRIPVIGLNLDRKIVSDIFKTGSTDVLSPEQKQALPADRDLDMPGYADRLSRIHDAHGGEDEGHGSPSGFSGFIQAQGIWDETMARNIAVYIANNPATRMVVLAGVQHVRKDSGIPPRVTRRIPVGQSSVLNILSENAPADTADIADFIFMAQPIPLPPAAKLGIVLEQEGTGDSSSVRITGLSPHGKAGAVGLKENDILLAINGCPVYNMEDVRIAMLDAEQGEMIMVKVRRGTEQKQEMEFQVVAQTPMRPHP